MALLKNLKNINKAIYVNKKRIFLIIILFFIYLRLIVEWKLMKFMKI